MGANCACAKDSEQLGNDGGLVANSKDRRQASRQSIDTAASKQFSQSFRLGIFSQWGHSRAESSPPEGRLSLSPLTKDLAELKRSLVASENEIITDHAQMLQRSPDTAATYGLVDQLNPNLSLVSMSEIEERLETVYGFEPFISDVFFDEQSEENFSDEASFLNCTDSGIQTEDFNAFHAVFRGLRDRLALKMELRASLSSDSRSCFTESVYSLSESETSEVNELIFTNIQDLARGYLVRKTFRDSLRRRKEAQIELQCLARGYLARLAARDSLRRHKETQCLTGLQNLLRGYLARKAVNESLRRMKEIQLELQSLARGYIARQTVSESFRKMKKARLVTGLQSLARGYLARRAVVQIREAAELAASESRNEPVCTLLHSLARGYLVRQGLAELIPKLKGVRLPPGARFIHPAPDYSNAFTRRVEARNRRFVPVRDPLTRGETIELDPVMYEDLSAYIGEWNLAGQRNGGGTLMFPDATKIVGWFKADKVHYKARIIHPNGDFYEGELRNGVAHGQGKYTHANGTVYEGQWKNDQQSGKGVETWSDGTRYEGSFLNNAKHGEGRLQWPNNSYYVGSFARGEFEGYGEYYWTDGKSYKGAWKNGKMHGYGRLDVKGRHWYTGDFEQDQRHGQGTMCFADGRKYTGPWRHDNPANAGGFNLFLPEIREKLR